MGSLQGSCFAQRCQMLHKADVAGQDQRWQLGIESGSRDLSEPEQGERANPALR